MDRRNSCHLNFVAALVVLCIAACSPPIPTGSGYGPVSKEMLVGADFSHPAGGVKYGKLNWEFSETEFMITTDGDSLPPGLVEAIAGEPLQAKQIEGTWDMQGEVLLISNVTIDDVDDVPGERSLRIFFTGVIRIQIPGTQYVFSHARNNRK